MTSATRAGVTATSAHAPGRTRHGRVIALVPAHNEADWIERVVANLLTQTCPPDRVVVISDNSTDTTARLARQAGAEAWESEDNRNKKAGALNQALARLLPFLDNDDFVFIQENEFARDGRIIDRRGNRTRIVVGTSARSPTCVPTA